MIPPPAGLLRRGLTSLFNIARYAGRCNICGRRGLFKIRLDAWDRLRETLDCPRCGSVSRDRFLGAVISACLKKPAIMADWPVDRTLIVKEPSGYRGRAAMLAGKVGYRAFRYPEESLEALPDGDASIDHLITSDVFEHVRLDEVAFREIYRVLKPGGYFFLQVPYAHAEHTRVLVEPRGDEDVFLCPPQYHDEHTLVYRIYGHDLLPKLERLGFSVGYVRRSIRRFGVPCLDMIVCRKDALLEADQRHLIGYNRQWPG